MNSIRAFYLKHWTAKRAAKHFANANYGSVLKTVPGLLESQTPLHAHLNLYRLIALRALEKEQWASDLAALNQDRWLDDFGRDEKNYLLVFLLDRLFGEIDIEPYILLKNVSEATKAAFPIAAQSPKFARFFRRPEHPAFRFKAENYIWLSGTPANTPDRLRFSGNFQNHKLFCLGKGSSLFNK